MELWIRSQKGANLIKIDNLLIEGFDNSIETRINDGYYELGTYETNERALEVLDEIQNIITSSVSCTPIIEDKTKPSDKQKRYEIEKYVITFDQLNVIVYQMPEE